MNLYPPYLGAGVRVIDISDDYTYIKVRMKLRWYNRNYVRTQFGGSLYSMVDPFYMLMLMQHLGKTHYIWDKSASIDFVKPGHGTVYAEFTLDLATIDKLNADAAATDKAIYPQFIVNIVADSGETVASVQKNLYIKRKPCKAEL